LLREKLMMANHSSACCAGVSQWIYLWAKAVKEVVEKSYLARSALDGAIKIRAACSASFP